MPLFRVRHESGSQLKTARIRASVGDLEARRDPPPAGPAPQDVLASVLRRIACSRGALTWRRWVILYGSSFGCSRLPTRSPRTSTLESLSELALVIVDLQEQDGTAAIPTRNSVARLLASLANSMLSFSPAVSYPQTCDRLPRRSQILAIELTSTVRGLARRRYRARGGTGNASRTPAPRGAINSASARSRSYWLKDEQIAKSRRTLFISESTTKVHVRHIYEKLGVHTRAGGDCSDPGARSLGQRRYCSDSSGDLLRVGSSGLSAVSCESQDEVRAQRPIR